MNVISAIQNGFTQGIIFYPVVLALSLSYRILKFPDISVEGTFALGAAVFAVTLNHTNSVILALLTATLSCAVSGSITSVLHYKLRINKFLAGIIVVTALYSVTIRVIGGSNISLLRFSFATANLNLIYLFCSIGISVLVYIFYKSRLGIKIRGSALNPTLSKNTGYKTGLLLLIGLAFNNLIASISGIYFSLDAGFADVKLGQGTLIISLAALAIGERLIPKKIKSVLSYVILSAAAGSIFYQFLWALALQLDIQPSDLKLLSALIVVILFVIKRRDETDDEL